jgi:4'-phosphopantetheinyl transferase
MQTSHPQAQNSKKVFVWIESILIPNLRVSRYLSADEKERANKYRTQQLRNRFVTARGRLREILGDYIGVSPNEIEFTYNSFGKPSIHPKHASPVQFNLSHSQDRLAIALTENVRVGIDIERHSDIRELPKLILSDQELKLFNDLPESDRAEQLFRVWTLKEAYLKGLGCGLNNCIRAIEVLRPGYPKDIFLTPWALCTLSMEAGWACAIAVETPNYTLQQLR